MNTTLDSMQGWQAHILEVARHQIKVCLLYPIWPFTTCTRVVFAAVSLVETVVDLLPSNQSALMRSWLYTKEMAEISSQGGIS